jgi:hypothetical protein
MTAHQGLEELTISNGTQVAAGTSVPAGSFASAPTGSYAKTATGFTLTTSSGRAVTYNTTAGNANVIGTQSFKTTVTGGTNTIETTLTNGAASNLTYSTYGVWAEVTAAGAPLAYGTLAAGVVSTTAQMPTTGTATYNGNLQGFGINSATAGRIAAGTVVLNANFAANTMTGTITNISTRAIGAVDTSPAGVMNNINLTGGTISGVSFSGTAAAAASTAAAGTPLIDITGATGTFGGKFYGPAAAEAVGSVVLTGPGGINVTGAFGTKKN